MAFQSGSGNGSESPAPLDPGLFWLPQIRQCPFPVACGFPGRYSRAEKLDVTPQPDLWPTMPTDDLSRFC